MEGGVGWGADRVTTAIGPGVQQGEGLGSPTSSPADKRYGPLITGLPWSLEVNQNAKCYRAPAAESYTEPDRYETPSNRFPEVYSFRGAGLVPLLAMLVA
ncbi:hypothetical protein EYF80_025865 [Liparis tanakae]|uniref:Uncharacterized protein n=1 Tax=Liparis tanakae TaxID=230148 RepID=A0A4Z2HGG7_9TELE|nr:hypothetical protein EYF80_025865 [Liparis tanakae]